MTISAANFHELCDTLAEKDTDLQNIIEAYGYPPLWSRPNHFESLVHIVLEQQVSLASALATLNKLRERIGTIEPATLLPLSDEELKNCYVSRQKASYLKDLAAALLEGRLDLEGLACLPDEEVRKTLTAFRGIGNWTVDVYLMFVLQRPDLFPFGDLAAVNSLKRVKRCEPGTTTEALMQITEGWRPLRTVATMILWHHYLSAPLKRRTTKLQTNF